VVGFRRVGEREEAAIEDLKDTVVAITGASSGIGRATARELARAGARVVLGARRRERLEALEAEFPGQAVAVEMDVRSPDDAGRLVREAVERFGRLDSLVANAGIGMYGGILDHTDEALATMLDTNVGGTVWPIRAALPEMIEAGHGDIVIVASVAGFRGGANEAVYAATKFAQVGLAGSLDRELRDKGIRVTTIAPAGTATEFAIGAGRTEDMPELGYYLRPEDIAFAIRTVLEQPRRLRTQYWTIWSMAQGS
jgi:NADP-dependent 3-hydroxy acid dehydrogenase YdfG